MPHAAPVIVALVLSLFSRAAPAQTVDPAPGPAAGAPAEQFARQLATALQVHDQSVRTLDWEQTQRIGNTPGAEAVIRSHQWLDERGRWACRHEDKLRENDGFAPLHTEYLFFDGQWLKGWDENSKSGSINGYNGNRQQLAGIDGWFGRHVDVASHQRLSEYLLAAKDLRVARWSENGLPVLEATAELRYYVALLEVEVDPAHGFAPRSITMRDRLVRVPYFRCTVTEWTRVGELWLPCKGEYEARALKMSNEQAVRFAEELAAAGLSRDSDRFSPEVQAGFVAVLQRVFGSDEAPSAPRVPHTVVEAQYLGVNVDLGDKLFTARFPAAFHLYDTIHDFIRPPDAADWMFNLGSEPADGPDSLAP